MSDSSDTISKKPVTNENLQEVSPLHCALIFVDKFDIGSEPSAQLPCLRGVFKQSVHIFVY